MTTNQDQTVTADRKAYQAVAAPAFVFNKDSTEPQRPETMQQLQDRLRDSFIQYKETAQKCQIQFKNKTSNEQFSRLYYSPNVPFFEEPEKQKQYRKEFIQDVSKLPEPKPIVTLADILHQDWAECLADQSTPNAAKDMLVMFYTRRSAQLQHKKHKLIKRWANTYSKSQFIDQISSVFDRELSYLQVEQDSVTQRLMRLQPDDRYCQDDDNERPKPTSNPQPDQQSSHEAQEAQKLYKEADQQCNDSALRQDDFEIYLRHTSYVNAVIRPAKKLIQSFKWLTFGENRYEIWYQSRLMIYQYKTQYKVQKKDLLTLVSIEVKRKLAEIGVIDEKGIDVCTDRYIYHLKENKAIPRAQQMLETHKFTHYEPFMLFSGRAELKYFLVALAGQYGLNCAQLDLDQGQMFMYQLQTFFPSKFEKQIRAMTFDWEDAGANCDVQMVDRLTRSLGLSKDALLSQMSQISADQRSQSLLNALNVGKTGAADMTLKDLTENELNKDQFTRHNLLRKLRQIEFFSLEESEIRMRRADWLEYVCWQPQISVYVQRQNQHLSSNKNQIDHLLQAAIEFTDVNDSVIVNKIIEDSVKVHIQKINDVQAKISQCMGASSNMRDADQNIDAAIRSLVEATNPAIARKMAAERDQTLTEADQAKYNKFQDIPNVDPLVQNLTKAFYTLRVIKSRDIKIHLLQVINYFRAIQRILALDVREFMTREKAYGDHLDIIDPHFGNNSKGQSILKMQSPAGPSEIFNTTVERELDTSAVRGVNLNPDPITYKAYKYNHTFEPIAVSTCPIVPKHHRTFGRPSMQERISAQINKERAPEVNFDRMKSLLTMRDRLHVDYQTKEIYVTNEFGMRVIYYEALGDMSTLEEELIKIGSYFINKYEFVIKNNEVLEPQLNDGARPTSLIDRPQIAMDLLEREYNYQFSKVGLIEQYMEIYEHSYDPLESMRILQIIADIIVARPRLNMEASMYCESYQAETEVLNEKRELLFEFMQMQKKHELKENQSVHNYIEQKIIKYQENVDQYWAVKRESDKVRRVGSDENPRSNQQNHFHSQDKSVDQLLQQKIQQTEKMEAHRLEQLAKIKERHITEFANRQAADFATVLGLPQVTMEQLYMRFDESEPIVIDALRESAFFSQMVEGYPLRILDPNQQHVSMGQHTPDCNLTDFFESYQIVSLFNAALVQSFQEIERETTPENGFVASCLEVCMLKKARTKLREYLKIRDEGGENPYQLKGQDFFEEDFYLGNCDKLLYQMKMLHMEANEQNLYKMSNPLVMSKLDTLSVQNFNFPRIKNQEVVEALKSDGIENIQDQTTSKLLQMAKNSVARPNLSYLDKEEDKAFSFEENQAQSKVKVPSIMRMFCNIVEVLRLREQIILRMNESIIIGRIYEYQCQMAGKSNKYAIGEQISFNTQVVCGDNQNIVDQNDGMNLNFDNAMPFMEYDRTLAANLDFKSDSCIKALFTDLGTEEIRAITHLQIAHQHLLTVAVRTNQILVDKPLKGVKETELLKEGGMGITTPNSIIDLKSILGSNGEGISSGNMGLQEASRMRLAMQKGIADQFYMVLPKKQRERQVLTKRVAQVQQKLMSSDQPIKQELILRILRSYRLQLCYGYCMSMVQEAQKDSIKIQLLETCNALRQRATLLPEKSQIFRLGKSDTQENLSFEANSHLRKLREFTVSENADLNIQSMLQGQALCSSNSTMFYIPSSEEICLVDRLKDATRVLKEHTQDHVQASTVDSVVKGLYRKYGHLAHSVYKMEEKQAYGVRKVWMEETPNLMQHDTFLILCYCTQVLNIFDLEYTMLRNLSKSWQTQALEDKALSGRPFWSEVGIRKIKFEQRALQEHINNDALVENKTSMKVIKYLDERKMAWIDLEEDLNQVALRMRRIQKECQNLTSEKQTLPYLCDLLTLQHHSTYFSLMNGIENMLDYYLDKNNDEYFHKLLLVRDQLSFKNLSSVKLIRSNGFYIQQAQIAAHAINLDASFNEEFKSFKQAYQPVIDERCLIPRQITLLRSLYGQACLKQQRETRGGYTDLLMTAFYNMDDDSRALMGANFTQVDDYIDDYLVFKGLKDAPNHQGQKMTKGKDHFQEQLLAQVEILSFKIEASALERVIMCWEQQSAQLPTTTKEIQQVQRKFRDAHTMAILYERDQLNDLYWQRQKKVNPNPLKQSEREREILAGLLTQRQNKQQYYSKINQLRAETIVIKQILDVNLIRIAIDMVRNEHSALQACFEASAQDKQIRVYVHPSQQFASTPYSMVDRAPHLDVVAKVGILQQFLTRLRNRCTEVATLTSGPGLVFSMKDFNDCISLFARQLIKYSEEELRGRTETANLKQYQYHHIIYISQMESMYYRKKCEQLLTNIETLTNAKMLSQGNQMIYELDVGARELQTLKDHYYTMEKYIRQEIRREFSNEILEKGLHIAKEKDKFSQYKRELNLDLAESIAKEISQLDNKFKSQNYQRMTSLAYGLKTERVESDVQYEPNPELISQILALTKYCKKQKIFYALKTMLREQKFQAELADEKQKQSQNQSLWEQHAEAEKREQITQQELIITKNNLIHYERLIEKLYSQLEHLNNQKLRLEQYKKNRSKQITELESKMQDLEILESLDLNKILKELNDRKIKINSLQKVDQNFDMRLEQIEQQHKQQVNELKKQLAFERQAKVEAFEKLDAMRVEMKTLEGKDTIKNDLWKDKCKELYDICRDLELENDQLKQACKELQAQCQQSNNKQWEVQSNTLQNSTSDQSGFAPLTREQIILQRKKYAGKPLTASSDHGGARRGFTGKHMTSQPINRNNPGKVIESAHALDSLKISAEGYGERRLNTLRQRDNGADQQQQQKGVGSASQSSHNETATNLRTSYYPPNHFMTVTQSQKSAGVFPQVSSMPQIKGLNKHFPMPLPQQPDEGPLAIDSGTLRIKKQ